MYKRISAGRLPLFFLLLPAGSVLLASCHKNYNNSSTELSISSFVPASAAMGATVVINGTGFNTAAQGNTVLFNGVAATVLSASSGSLTVTVPQGAHDGKITVQTGGPAASSTADFTYIYTVSTLAGDGVANYKEGAGTTAEFNLPFGVAADAAGNVYVTDNANNRIRKINAAGVVSTLAGDGMASYKDAVGTAAQFRAPVGVAFDGAGNMYIADANNKRIRKIVPDATVSTVAGDGTTGFKDATGLDAEFYTPIGVVADGHGNVYVADANNHRVRKISPGGAVSTLAGNGTAGYKEGSGTDAEFNFPTGVAADATGNIYVADNYNHRIRKINPDATVSTLAGDGHPGFKEGAGAAAAFNSPGGVAADAAGNIYVADTYNHRIRKISPAGIVRTLAGNGTGGFKDGTGIATQFNEPTGVAVDAAGNIYVADNGNHRIRKLQ